MEKCRYHNYEQYVEAQKDRSHTQDDQLCRYLNNLAMDIVVQKMGSEWFPKKILDIGCRDACWFEDWEIRGALCMGIEISPISAEYAQSRGRKVICRDVHHMLGRDICEETVDRPDCVWMAHSIEHLLNPSRVLKWLREQTADDAVVVVRCPDQKGKLEKGKLAHVWAWELPELCCVLRESWTIVFYMPFRGEWLFVLAKQGIDCRPEMMGNLWQPMSADERARIVELTADEWLRKKIGREDRLKDKKAYVKKYLPEIRKGQQRVLDIGCGPSEFMEVCRYHFNTVRGVDTPLSGSLMGDSYREYSAITCRRKLCHVDFFDFYEGFKKGLPYHDNEFTLVHSQGAMNQIFARHIDWTGNKEGYIGSWVANEELEVAMWEMLAELKRITESFGIIFLYANASKNDDTYNQVVRDAAKKAGLLIEGKYGKIIHRLRVRK